MNHSPIKGHILFITHKGCSHIFVLCMRKRWFLEGGCIECETMPLGFFGEGLGVGLDEWLVGSEAHPAGDWEEALALFEIGNGACHGGYIILILWPSITDF
jgi:hypothetical protein